MGMRATLGKPLAKLIAGSIERNAARATETQNYWFKKLVATAKQTRFGREHGFAQIKSYADFKKHVPIRDYEAMQPFTDALLRGESNVLWPGKPLYFAKTSGTTSGTKYIPITKASISNHFNSARNSVMLYVNETGNTAFMDGKLVYLSGSPVLKTRAGILSGRLSGIANHHIPAFWRVNQLPTYTTNCIEEWENKLDAIVQETIGQDVRLISGIPPWIQMYFDKINEVSGKTVHEVFPNFSLLVHGGVNFEPYRAKLENSVGKHIDTVETFPASEGFIAYQYRQQAEGLLLNTHSGIFFEFVPVSELNSAQPIRHSLAEIETGVNYATILSSNAGLWAYNLGDTVTFTSRKPPLLQVTGRVKHYISAFGEHVISQEVEQALLQVANKEGVKIVEFTVAPKIQQSGKDKSYHEWLVEFDEPPLNLPQFTKLVDTLMQEKNTYYADLIKGNVLQPLKIVPLRAGSFIRYMKSVGKLGGQNKVPRLSNNRQLADALLLLQNAEQ